MFYTLTFSDLEKLTQQLANWNKAQQAYPFYYQTVQQKDDTYVVQVTGDTKTFESIVGIGGSTILVRDASFWQNDFVTILPNSAIEKLNAEFLLLAGGVK